jgi:hypothetical protein
MPHPSNLAQQQRQQEKQRFQRCIAALLVGSGLVHGLAIGLVYLKPTAPTLPPEPEMEIVIEEAEPEILADLPIDEAMAAVEDASAASAPATGGSASDDESPLAIGGLTPAQAVDAAPSESDTAPTPTELTDSDMDETLVPETPTTANPQNPADPNSKNPIGPVLINGDPQGDPNNRNPNLPASLLKPSNGPKGDPTKPPSNNPAPAKPGPAKPGPAKPGIKPGPTQPAPKPPTQPAPAKPSAKPPAPAKPTPPKRPDEYAYSRQKGERTAIGSKARIIPQYDDRGRVTGGKLATSTGDAELDAAQLRAFDRTLATEKG